MKAVFVCWRPNGAGGLEILGRYEDMRRLAAHEARMRAFLERHGKEPTGAAAVELRDLRALEVRLRDAVTSTGYPSAKAAFRRIDEREREEMGGRRPDPWNHEKSCSARGWRVWRISEDRDAAQTIEDGKLTAGLRRELVQRDGAPTHLEAGIVIPKPPKVAIA